MVLLRVLVAITSDTQCMDLQLVGWHEVVKLSNTLDGMYTTWYVLLGNGLLLTDGMTCCVQLFKCTTLIYI